MAKVTIPTISSGFASTTQLNTALDTIETQFNSKVLYRNNPSGEPNYMETSIDMNGHSLLNLSDVSLVTGESLSDSIQTATDAATTAQNAADTATALVGTPEFAAVSAITGEITTVAGISSSVVSVANNAANIAAIGPSTNSINIVATDLAGNGFNYDMGLITDTPAGSGSAPDGYIQTVADNIASVIDVANALPINIIGVSDGDKGDITVSSSGTVWTIDNTAVTSAKLNSDVYSTAHSWTAQQTFKEIKETVFTITDGASVDIDPANGTIQTWTLGASRTPTATNFEAGQAVTLMIADGTTYAVTWTTIGVVWVGGTAPTLPTSGYGVIVLWKVGSTVYGKSVGNVA